MNTNLQKFIYALNVVCQNKTNSFDLQSSKLFIIRTINDIDPQYLLNQIIPRVNANIKNQIYDRQASQDTKRLIYDNIKCRRIGNASAYQNTYYSIEKCQNQLNIQPQIDQSQYFKKNRIIKGMVILLNLKQTHNSIKIRFTQWKVRSLSQKRINYDYKQLNSQQTSFIRSSLNASNIVGAIKGISYMVQPAHQFKMKCLTIVDRWKSLNISMKKDLKLDKSKIGISLAENIKKISYLPLQKTFDILSNHRRSALQKLGSWRFIARKSNIQGACRKTVDVFEQLHLSIIHNTQIILSRPYQQKLKQSALKKLFLTQVAGRNQAFKQWKTQSIKRSLTARIGNNNKEICIKTITTLLNNNLQSQIYDVINKFSNNKKMQQIKKRCLMNLLKSKTGKVILGFFQWKNLRQPTDQLKNRLANKFQRGLINFYTTIVKQSLKSLKYYNQEGLNKKRICAIRLVYISSSGMKKKFEILKNLSAKTKIQQICRKIRQNFQLVEYVTRQNTALILERPDQQKKKLAAIQKLLLSQITRRNDSFKLWKTQSIKLSFQLKIGRQAKEKCLKTIDSFLNNSMHGKIYDSLMKFVSNKHIIQLQQKYLKKLLNSKIGKVIIGFSSWKSLPIPSNSIKSKLANRFQRGLHTFAVQIIKQSIKQFKIQSDQGFTKKRQCALTLVHVSGNQLKKKFDFWKNLYHKIKIQEACRRVGQLIHIIQLTYKNSTNIFLQRPAQQIKKLAAIEKLYSVQLSKRVESFRIWKNQSKKISLSKKLNADQKQSCLKTIDSFLNNSIQGKVYDTIKKFMFNKQEHETMKKYLSHILNSKVGRVLIGFSSWKSLPNPSDSLKNKLANKFQRGLSNFASTIVRFVIKKVKQQSQVGNNKKRSAAIVIINTCSSGYKKKFDLWKDLAMKYKIKLQCKNIIDFLQLSQIVIRDNTGIVLQKFEDQKKKLAAIDKLLTSQVNRRNHSFKIWRSEAIKFSYSLKIGKQSKESCLKTIDSFIKNSIQGKIYLSIKKFQANKVLVQVQKKFLKSILNSKVGKVVIGFLNWKSLPVSSDSFKSRLANKFQRGLYIFASNVIKKSIKKLKQQSQQGSTIKRKSALVLVRISGNNIKKKFDLWKQLSFKYRIQLSCKSVTQLLENIQLIFRDNTSLVLQKPANQRKKLAAIDKLISSQLLRRNDTFKIWRSEAIKLSLNKRIGKQTKQACLKTLDSFLNNSMQGQLYNVIKKFSNNKNINQIQKKYLSHILNSKVGRVLIGFANWKSLPVPNLSIKTILANKFQRGLSQFSSKYIKKTITPIKIISDQGKNKKRLCALVLVHVSSSDIRKKYNLWKKLSQKNKIQETCRKVGDLFQIILNNARDNSSMILQRPAQQRKKLAAIDKLISSQLIRRKDSFSLWRSQAIKISLSLRIGKETKQSCLKTIDSFLKSSSFGQTYDVIKKFQTNKDICEIKKKYLNHILNSKMGRVIIGFVNWKSLPDLSQLKLSNRKISCMKLQRQLYDFIKANLKLFFKPFYEDAQQGINIKRSAIIKLVNITMSGQKKMFLLWRHRCSYSKIVQTCKATDGIFQLIHQTIISNSNIVLQNPQDLRVKLWALQRLFVSNENCLRFIFKTWRSNSQQKSNLLNQLSQRQRTNALSVIQRMALKAGQLSKFAILESFYQNWHTQQIQKRFFLRILNTKSGVILKILTLWKSLPQKSDSRLIDMANIFQSGLKTFISKVLKSSLEPLKQDHYYGQNIKKKIAAKLSRLVMSQNTKKFNHWKMLSKELLTIDSSNKINSCFDIINKKTIENSFNQICKKNGYSINLTKILAKANKQHLIIRSKVINKLKQNCTKSRQCNKLKAAVKLNFIYNRRVRQAKHMSFIKWLQNSRENKWIKRCIIMLASNPNISQQISLWRMLLISQYPQK